MNRFCGQPGKTGATENPDLVAPFRMTAGGRLKAEYEKRRYPATDFRHYKTRWDGVNGWLTYEQAEWLFEKAKEIKPAGDIVEIGSAYGRSTVCLGSGVKLSKNGKIFSVDPHIGGKGFREQLKDKDSYSSLDGFRENLKRFGIEAEVKAIVKTSEDALKSWSGKGIRLLFIDGWHTYDAVTHDIFGWEKHVVPGGLIALHDYQDEGVRRAIHDCMRKIGVSEKKLKFVNGEMVYFEKG